MFPVLFLVKILMNNNLERKGKKVVVALPYLYWSAGVEEIRIASVLDVTGNLRAPPPNPPERKYK